MRQWHWNPWLGWGEEDCVLGTHSWQRLGECWAQGGGTQSGQVAKMIGKPWRMGHLNRPVNEPLNGSEERAGKRFIHCIPPWSECRESWQHSYREAWECDRVYIGIDNEITRSNERLNISISWQVNFNSQCVWLALQLEPISITYTDWNLYVIPQCI